MNKYKVWFWDKYDKEEWNKQYSALSIDEAREDAENDLIRGESVTEVEYIGPDPDND